MPNISMSEVLLLLMIPFQFATVVALSAEFREPLTLRDMTGNTIAPPIFTIAGPLLFLARLVSRPTLDPHPVANAHKSVRQYLNKMHAMLDLIVLAAVTQSAGNAISTSHSLMNAIEIHNVKFIHVDKSLEYVFHQGYVTRLLLLAITNAILYLIVLLYEQNNPTHSMFLSTHTVDPDQPPSAEDSSAQNPSPQARRVSSRAHQKVFGSADAPSSSSSDSGSSTETESTSAVRVCAQTD